MIMIYIKITRFRLAESSKRKTFKNMCHISTSVKLNDDYMIGRLNRVPHNYCHASALADHLISTGHNIKWDNFEIIATGKSDLQYKSKESLFISELKPSLSENVGSEKTFLY